MNKPKSAISYIWPYYDDSKTKELVSRSFSEAMTVLSNHVERVVLEAQQSLINLDRLDEHLITLHEIIHRENSSAIADKEELLASLWTQLGRNKQKIRGLDGHLYLLQNLGDYRMRAKAHVIAALHTLESISEDMEELREQVSAPGLVGDTVPVEVHLNSIKSGLDRLTQKRHTAQIRGEEAMQSIIGDLQDSQS